MLILQHYIIQCYRYVYSLRFLLFISSYNLVYIIHFLFFLFHPLFLHFCSALSFFLFFFLSSIISNSFYYLNKILQSIFKINFFPYTYNYVILIFLYTYICISWYFTLKCNFLKELNLNGMLYFFIYVLIASMSRWTR